MNDVDCTAYMNEILTSFSRELYNKPSTQNNTTITAFNNHFLVNFDSEKYPNLRHVDPLFFVVCHRNLESFLNYLKIGDIVIGISTISKMDVQNINKTPADSINIIDEIGNKAIGLMRSQGHLPFISNILEIEKLDKSKHKIAKFYSKRLIQEEFTENSSCHFIENREDFVKVFHEIQNKKRVMLSWRETRGYLLVDKLDIDINVQGNTKLMKLSGYLKNSCGLENLYHITGYGDFKPKQIECQVEVKWKPIARFIKNPTNTDDFKVYNSQGNEFSSEQAEDTGMIKEDKNESVENEEYDEFEELKKNFKQLKFTETDGHLKRRKEHRHASNGIRG